MAPLRNASSEDDESDSISIISTAGSEPRDTYLVERILAENTNEADDSPIYLVKWEGYPIHRSTWEGAESFEDDTILFNWKEQKMKEARGLAEEFDLATFLQEQDAIEQAKEQRRSRRRAKRRKLGLEAERGESSDEDDVPSKSEKANKAETRDSAPRRKQKTTQKGYALPEDPDFIVEDGCDAMSDRSRPKRRRKIIYSDDEDHSSSADSLMQELSISKPKRRQQEQKSGPIAQTAKPSVKIQPSAKAVLADSTNQKSAAAATVGYNTLSKAQSKPADRTGQAVKRVAVSGASHAGSVGISATKAAPTSKKKALGAGIFSNWNTVKKPRQRPRVNLETANTFGEKGFTTASRKRRFELFGRNEPAPDPEKLQFISLSGQGPSPKSTLAAGSVHNDLDIDIADRPNKPLDVAIGRGPVNSDANSADGPGTSHAKSVPRVRAVGFADERRNRIDTEISRSPDQREEATPSTAPSNKQPSVPAALQTPQKAMQPRLFPPGTKSTETCPYWARGDCRLPAANCGYQHVPTGVVPDYKLPKYSTPPITCYYWSQAHCKQPPNLLNDCKKPANICAYAHWDTGVLASPPKGSVPIPISEAQSNEPSSASNRSVDVLRQNYDNRLEPITHISSVPPPKGPSGGVLTCYYWATRGWCTKRDEECWFAHYHTGLVAKQYNPRTIGTGKQTLDYNQRILSSIMQNSPLPPASTPSSLELTAQVSSNLNSAVVLTPFTFSTQQQSNKGPPARTPSEMMNDVNVTLRIEVKGKEHSVELQTRFTGFDLPSRSKFLDAAGPTPIFVIEHLCLAEDLGTKLVEEKMEIYAFGMVVPASQQSADAVDMFSESLNLHGGAGVIFRHDFCLVVYAVHQETWKFLDDGKPAPTADARLRFQILDPVQPPPKTLSVAVPVEGRSSYLTTLFRNILATDMETLCRREDETIEKVAFIMWPPGLEDELELIAEFLQDHKLKVYLSTVERSWSYFLQKYATGIILIHPSVHHYWQIYKFNSVLRKGFNIFQLGVDSHSGPSYTCIRLFPHGRVVYITDDVFEKYSADALAVLKRFVYQAGRRPAGFWKIAGRPGLKTWLLGLAEKVFHNAARKKEAANWVELYTLIDKLVPPELTDPWHPEDPSDNAPLVSVSVRHLPDYAGMWDENPKKASNYMVNWFAGWACTKATQFKRFIVVHPWPIDDWLAAYKHIEFVTPAEYGNLTQGI